MRLLRPTDSITESKIKDALKDFIDPKKFTCQISDGEYELKNSKSALANDLRNLDKNFSIVFLGTGASLPSKYRNVSCTLVYIRYVILHPFYFSYIND